MDEEDFWKQIEDLLNQALQCEPVNRPRFLASIEHSGLRAEVSSLLTADDNTLELHIEKSIQECAPSLKREASMRGRILGHFKLPQHAGSGGMSEVYLARDIDLARTVALKLLPRGLSTDGDRVRRFKQEARAASALNHPNIVTIYEVSEIDGQLFIATEYVPGETLQMHCERGGMTIPEVLAVMEQTASALAAAHQAGIIHRDIKPGNIMLRPEGTIKVLDFGLARIEAGSLPELAAASGEISAPTIPGIILGTPAYMSPEHCRGNSIDCRADLWSLGAVLYEMLTGRPAFSGENTLEILAAVLEKQPVPPSHLNPEISKDLDRLALKLLAKDPAQRFSSALDVVEELKRLRVEASLFAQSRAHTPVIKKGNRKRFVIAIATVILIVLIAGWWMKSRTPHALPVRVTPEVSFTYSITVQDMTGERAGKPYQSSGDDILPSRSRFRLNVSSLKPGFFYLLGEDHSNDNQQRYTALFPIPSVNGGSAQVGTAQVLNTGWYRFRSDSHEEKVWLIWATQPVTELESLLNVMNPESKGAISEPSQRAAIEALLARRDSAAHRVPLENNPQRVTLAGGGNILVTHIQLRHR